MEEDYVSLLHLKINPISLQFFIVFYSKVGLVDLTIPIRIGMFEKGPLVSFWQNIQTAVISIAVLKSGPSCHYSVCWTEWKIGKILMEGVS